MNEHRRSLLERIGQGRPAALASALQSTAHDSTLCNAQLILWCGVIGLVGFVGAVPFTRPLFVVFALVHVRQAVRARQVSRAAATALDKIATLEAARGFDKVSQR